MLTKLSRSIKPLIDGDNFKLWPYVGLSHIQSLDISLLEVTKDGHGKTANMASDRLYYVLDGNGYFEFDNQTIQISKNDVVIVPRGDVYNFFSTSDKNVTLLLINTPMFQSEYEHKFD